MTGLSVGGQAAYLTAFVTFLVFWRLLVTVAVVGCVSVSFLCWREVFPGKKRREHVASR